MGKQLKPGDTYETYEYATCQGCNTRWIKHIECEAVKPGVYHRKVRDLGEWEPCSHAGSSFAIWNHYDWDEHPKCPNHIKEKSQLALF